MRKGVVYQRQDGVWVASTSLGFDGQGKRLRKTLYGKTRKEVAAKLRELQNAKAEGLPVARRDITIDALLTEYLATCKPELDARKIQTWMRTLQESGLSAHTVGLSRAVLRRKVLKGVGLEGVRIHDLRHLCASLLLAKGIHARVVMEILGHSQISLTMNTYSHVLPGVSASAMDELLSAPRGESVR